MTFFTIFLKGIAQGYLFRFLSRFINPELINGIIFTSCFFAYNFVSTSILTAIANAILLEFIILHANFFNILTALSSTNQLIYQERLIKVNSFYIIFVIAFGIGLNAWFFVFNYIWLLFFRFRLPYSESMKKELAQIGVFTLIRILIFLLAGLIAGLVNLMLSAEDNFALLLWGTLFYWTLFLSSSFFKRLADDRFILKTKSIIAFVATNFNSRGKH